MSEKPWFLHYPDGVPHEILLRPETLLAMFSRSVQRFPRRPALYFFGKTLSYQECHSLIERFACGLAALGIRKGDRVALCLPNSPQAVIAYYGILRAGGIVVACNPIYTEYELSHQLRDAGARAIVVLDILYQKVQHLDLPLTIVTRITDFMTTIAKYIYQRRNHKPPLVIPSQRDDVVLPRCSGQRHRLWTRNAFRPSRRTISPFSNTRGARQEYQRARSCVTAI